LSQTLESFAQALSDREAKVNVFASAQVPANEFAMIGIIFDQ
jgi:hypothetical protein